MPRCFFAIKTPLNRHCAVFVDRELPLTIGTSVDRIVHFALATLIWVSGCKRFETISNTGVLLHCGFDIRFLELGLIIVYITQLYNYPGISDVIFIVVVVFTLRNIANKIYLIVTYTD